MTSTIKFSAEEQKDLLSAAVRLYEARMYDLCLNILHILISCDNEEAYILAGHCIAYSGGSNSKELSNKYYEISCNLGSAVGCYNLYESYRDDNNPIAEAYLQRAKEFGWED